MKNSINIKILPSKVILSEKDIVLLDELDKNKREEVRSCICKNISNQISNYYSSRREEWKNFISVMA